MSKLDEAKLNLKKVLERLENAVEVNLKSNTNVNGQELEKLRLEKSNLTAQQQEIKAELEDKLAEINYLREENFRLQAQIGEEQEKSIKLSAKNSEATRRVDLIISEFRNYISNNNIH